MQVSHAGALAFALLALASAAPARADTTVCKLAFDLRGWSAHFEQSVGRGTISCDNGQQATVSVAGHGSKLADGAGAVAGGHGTFSAVLDISALLGSYALPPAASAGGARPLGVAGAMTNRQATLSFPPTGPGSTIPATFRRFEVRGRSTR